jgi:hypothetical protein
VKDSGGGFFDPDYCDGGVAIRPRGRKTLKRKTPAQQHPAGQLGVDGPPPMDPSKSGDEGSQLGSPWETVGGTPAASDGEGGPPDDVATVGRVRGGNAAAAPGDATAELQAHIADPTQLGSGKGVATEGVAERKVDAAEGGPAENFTPPAGLSWLLGYSSSSEEEGDQGKDSVPEVKLVITPCGGGAPFAPELCSVMDGVAVSLPFSHPYRSHSPQPSYSSRWAFSLTSRLYYAWLVGKPALFQRGNLRNPLWADCCEPSGSLRFPIAKP